MRLPIQQPLAEHDGACLQGGVFTRQVRVDGDRIVIGEGCRLQGLVAIALCEAYGAPGGVCVHHEILKAERTLD